MTVLIRGNVKLRIPALKTIISRILCRSSFVMLTESVVDANGPGHSLLTLDGGKDLGRVLESNRAFT